MLGNLKLGATVGAISLLGGLGAGWWLGSSHVQGKWAKAELEAVTAAEKARDDAIADWKQANTRIENSEQALSEALTDIERLRRERDEAINREPLVKTRTVVKTIQGECPVCPVIDARAHWLHWNAAIRGEALPDAPEAVPGDGSMP